MLHKCTQNINLRRKWSGRRDSNPRLQPWQGCALPLSYAREKMSLTHIKQKSSLNLYS